MNFFKLFLILVSLSSFGYDSVQVDMNRWKTGNGKLKAPESNNKSIHLKLKREEEGILKIRSLHAFSIFIDNQLVCNNISGINWSLDSLKSIYAFPITISIYSSSGLNRLSYKLTKSNQDSYRKESNLKSAITVAVFLLIWVLIFLLNTNRAVTLEYFNFTKFFSIRSVDESVLSLRVTTLNNIFVYAFCSALIAINLDLLDLSPVLNSTQFNVINILLLTIGILLTLLAKILLIKVLAKIFSQSEIAPTQLFNFVKLALGCFTISSISLIIIFIVDIDTAFWRSSFIILISAMMGVYLVITFLRLINRGGFTVFHLFSYLCVSEIFPMLLLLKIYYF